MRTPKKEGGVGCTTPALKIARFFNRASPQYPRLPLDPNELAARVIGERFRLSPAVARTVVELVGYGRRA